MKLIGRELRAFVLGFGLFGAGLAQGASSSGTVVAWGTNWNGTAFVPLTVPVNLTNAVAVAAGYGDSLELGADGSVTAWGYNGSGQTNVPSAATNVISIAAGDEHCLALRKNGTVVGWGYNYFGQASVPAGLSNVVAIAAGADHSLALRGNGTVVAWGYNNSGQTNVPAGLTNAMAIAGGDFHSLALLSNGLVVAWGGNYNGQTNVSAGLSNVVAIAAGADHSLALKSDHTVVAWGETYDGMVYLPVTVPTGLSNVTAIAAAAGYSLALLTNGTVVAWGTIFNGTEYVPASVPFGLSNVVAIAAGYFHSLGITLGAGPAIVSWPPSPISLSTNGSTNLTVTVSAASTYGSQWYSNGVPIAGATGTTYAITNFDVEDAGVYSIIVSNQYAASTNYTVVRLQDSPVILVDGVDVGGGTVVRVDTNITVSMSSAFGAEADIYYTLDGSPPWFDSTPYTGPFKVGTSATIQAVAFNAAYSDSATSAPIFFQVWPTFPLSATTPGGGGISVWPAAYSSTNRYVSNTVVTLTATASDGWTFMQWTGDSTDTTNVTTLLMDRPRSVQAVFGTGLNLYTSGNGQVVLNPASGPYPYGSPVQLTALPANGSYFLGWKDAASGFNNPLTIQATNASGITALFAALHTNQVSLTVLPEANGSVVVSPFYNVYTNGDTVTLTAFPAVGNTFAGWSGDASGSTNPLRLLLDSSKSISANFVLGSGTNPPVVTQGPLSRTVTPGDTTTLALTLTGDAPFSYQWQLNGTPLTGATGSTLTLTNCSLAQVGFYSALVTNSFGAASSPTGSLALFSLEMANAAGQTFPLLILNGPMGASYRLAYGGDLTNWTLLAPVTVQDGPLYFTDDPVTNHARRFYRAVPQ
ncbi:MAG TPA: chitobiase/beta-hexosaminidase C-terminal domain-containing protein [Candidatus Acidoferrum sp.]|nr:chitobiase/beta-hexosaminidase C-terminal domain-containing protein [Candidatus Acidoferrum sp.]